MVIWTRHGLPVVGLALGMLVGLSQAFPTRENLLGCLGIAVGLAVFKLGRMLNSDDDVEEHGKHTLYGVSVELWGAVIAVACALSLLGVFKLLSK